MASRPLVPRAARTMALLGLLVSASAGAAEHVVKMQGYRFVPEQLTIQQGDTVRWTNGSSLTHTVTADPAKAKRASDVALPQGAQKFDSGNIPPGKEFSHTFDVAGSYTYFCVPHEQNGMVARITVQPAG